MSGRKIAIVLIPVIVAAIAIGFIFAFPSQQQPPEQNLAANNSSDNEGSNDGDVVLTDTDRDCNEVNDRVRNIVSLDTQGLNDTKIAAADTLVKEHCQRPELVEEIASMQNPGIGLVAYGCDSASGRIGDPALQSLLSPYRQIYCDNAFIVIFEESEITVSSAEQYMDQYIAEAENADQEDGSVSNNATSSANVEEIRSKIDQLSSFAKKAKSLLLAEKYYEAAKSLDEASKLANSLPENQ